jgi:hypothetical protein
MKMAAKLINCTKEEQRSVTRSLCTEGVPGAQIHLRMCAQYGDKVLSHRIVYEWIEMFENWRENGKSGKPLFLTEKVVHCLLLLGKILPQLKIRLFKT